VPAQPKVQLTTGRKALLQTKAKRYSKVAEAIVLGVKDNVKIYVGQQESLETKDGEQESLETNDEEQEGFIEQG